MARRKLASSAESDTASAYQTAAFRPGANTLLLLFVASARPLFPGGAPSAPVVTGNGLSWVQEQTVLYGANDDRRLTLFRASGAAPAAGGVTIDFGEDQQAFCAWSILEYDDVDVSVANGKSALAQSFTANGTGQSLSRSLSASADPGRNFAVGAIAIESPGGATISVTPGAGFAEIDEEDLAGLFVRAGALQTQDAAASNSVISWTWNLPQSAAAIILEVKAIPPPRGGGDGPGSEPEPGSNGTPAEDQALVTRFQPVMFFAPGETLFPSDAKRFVENAALWTAQPTEDDKTGWGGNPGAPFPRKATVAAMGLSADANEPGNFQFGTKLGAGNDHRFLELGGWKDLSEHPETGVTAASLNRYSDRKAITTLYDGTLKASRFWYHAEIIHGPDLRTIAGRVPGVDLSWIVDRLHPPTMLCYYFFFPAHDQTVESSDCQGLEAREVSSHAGDWQCFAILGEGVGDAFTPKFFGRTGLLPGGDTQFPPHQFDDDQNNVMVVGPWTAGSPALTDGYPRLFVAAGSHTLYTAPGSQAVAPYPTDRVPQWCGTSDAPGPADSGTNEYVKTMEDLSVLLAKMVSGGAFGFQGATAALVACVAEIAHYRAPTAPFGKGPSSQNPAPPEKPPAAPGAGKTIKPPGLMVPDAGADVVEWRCVPGQPAHLNNRTYDCMVNRSTQLWWPSFDTKSGFNGRWGQRVTADNYSRRCGPRFPNYPQMFVQALADGLGRTPPLLVLP